LGTCDARADLIPVPIIQGLALCLGLNRADWEKTTETSVFQQAAEAGLRRINEDARINAMLYRVEA
jgi:hypothetical protein